MKRSNFFCLVLVAIQGLIPNTQLYANSDSPVAQNAWMGKLPDDTRIVDMTIPASHDAAAVYGCPDPVSKEFAKTQDYNIQQQLEMGIRFFDFRFRCTGNSFALHHGVCYQQQMFGSVLNTIDQFLEKNPTEVVFILAKQAGQGSQPQPNSDSFLSILERYVSTAPNRFWRNTSGGFINPGELAGLKLGTLRSKIVLFQLGAPRNLFSSSIKYDQNPNILIQENHFVSDLNKKNTRTIKHLNNVYSTKDDLLYITYVNGNAFAGTGEQIAKAMVASVGFQLSYTPRQVANSVNPTISKHLNELSYGRYGVVMLDFPSQDLVDKLIRSNQRKAEKLSIQVRNKSPFDAHFTLTYKLPGKLATVETSGKLTQNQSHSFAVPADAYVQELKVEYLQHFGWKTIVLEQNKKITSISSCFKLKGDISGASGGRCQ
jgi:1-phosphatidylinositol phosphodiesterase